MTTTTDRKLSKSDRPSGNVAGEHCGVQAMQLVTPFPMWSASKGQQLDFRN